MSTKIYCAWRVELQRLNDFIDAARDQMLEAIRQRILTLMEALKLEELPPDDLADEARVRWEKVKRYTRVTFLCVDASRAPERDPMFCVDCGLNVWIHEGHAYIIPIGEEWLRHVVSVPFAEDFSYWDNVDPQEEVSAEAWEARGEMWEKINCGEGRASHNARRLYHDVMDLSKGAPWFLREAIFSPRP